MIDMKNIPDNENLQKLLKSKVNYLHKNITFFFYLPLIKYEFWTNIQISSSD